MPGFCSGRRHGSLHELAKISNLINYTHVHFFLTTRYQNAISKNILNWKQCILFHQSFVRNNEKQWNTTRSNVKRASHRRILEQRHKGRSTLWELDHDWAVQLLWPEPNSLFQFLNSSNHFETSSRGWAPRGTESKRNHSCCCDWQSATWLLAHNDGHRSLLLAIAHYGSTRTTASINFMSNVGPFFWWRNRQPLLASFKHWVDGAGALGHRDSRRPTGFRCSVVA